MQTQPDPRERYEVQQPIEHQLKENTQVQVKRKLTRQEFIRK